MTSERQERSNQANALQSTGPATEAGKSVTAQNALTHGLATQSNILAFWEDPNAFSVLAETIHADLAPVGAMEIVLVNRIVQLLWREARINRMELAVLYHAFVNAKGMGDVIADTAPVPYQPDPEQMTRQELQQQFDTRLGDAVAYDLSEGHALIQVDGFRFRNHRMLLDTVQTLQKMQKERKTPEIS